MKRKKREIGGDEKLPHHVVEEILKRLEVKSLIRLRCVSKQWNSTLNSTSFASRHLNQAPHVVYRAVERDYRRDKTKSDSYLCSWDIKSPRDLLQSFHMFPKSNSNFFITGSCDGLVCVYDYLHHLSVVNPTTRWSRSLPCSMFQNFNRVKTLDGDYYPSNCVGFGKDTKTGKYKMVWLCNFIKPDLEVDLLSTCEVFDFETNTWRYVKSSSHSISDRPLYLDGSLYWLTLNELKLIRFDLHTEVFQEMDQVLPMLDDTSKTVLCCLNNRLCITEKMRNNMNQEIWSLNSHKVWEKTYTINHTAIKTRIPYRYIGRPLKPVTIFNKTEMLLVYEGTDYDSLCFVRHDSRTGSSSLIRDAVLVHASSYIPSLISI